MNLLTPCPDSPNCVCSDDTGARHVAPFRIIGDASTAWQALLKHLQSRRGCTVISYDDAYLNAEATTLIWRFVDDVEFQLRPIEKAIAVRSASRVGYWDQCANRLRIESIRRALIAQGVITPKQS